MRDLVRDESTLEVVNDVGAYRIDAIDLERYEPVLIGGLDMGRFLMPGTPLAGERSAEEIRQIAAGLE